MLEHPETPKILPMCLTETCIYADLGWQQAPSNLTMIVAVLSAYGIDDLQARYDFKMGGANQLICSVQPKALSLTQNNLTTSIQNTAARISDRLFQQLGAMTHGMDSLYKAIDHITSIDIRGPSTMTVDWLSQPENFEIVFRSNEPQAYLEQVFGSFQVLLQRLNITPYQARPKQFPLSAQDMLLSGSSTMDALIENYSAKDLITLFTDQCKQTPNHVALIVDGKHRTYSELLGAVVGLAQTLSSHVKANDRIAVYAVRSENTLVSMLACLYLGTVYVPLDTKYPIDHINALLLQTEPELILSTLDLHTRMSGIALGIKTIYFEDIFSPCFSVPGMHSKQPLVPFRPVTDDHPFALLFTSGSTGRAKAVLHSQQSFFLRFLWQWNVLPLANNEVFAQRTTVNFGPHIWEFLFGLLKGHCTVVISDEYQQSAEKFQSVLTQYKVTRLALVPSMLNSLLDLGENVAAQHPLHNLRSISLAGEPLAAELCQKFIHQLPHVSFYNDFGSTETNCIFFNKIPTGADTPLTLGRASPAAQVNILSDTREPLAPYQTGLLFVGGKTLATSYLDPDGKSVAIRHGDGLMPVDKMYATGDHAYYTFSGEVLVTGRSGNQVKVRGMRINLDSLTEQYKQALQLNDIVLITQNRRQHENRLIAFIKSFPNPLNKVLQKKEIMENLRDHIPSYYLPSFIVLVDDIPKLLNGKVDRKAFSNLLKPVNSSAIDQSVKERLTHLIKDLVELPLTEEELLHLSFNEIGIDSLASVELLCLIHEEFGIGLKPKVVLENWSLMGLHRIIVQQLGLSEPPIVSNIRHATPQEDFDYLKSLIHQHSDSTKKSEPRHSGHILVTGATGHIGIHLLYHLLNEGSHNVVALVRSNAQSVVEKVNNKLDVNHLILTAAQRERLTVIEGDIQVPQFGLSREDYTHLAENTAQIVHLAASVNHMSAYANMREALVSSWEQVIRFCVKAKVENIVFASSISVLLWKDGEVHRSELTFDDWSRIASGYGQTKWLGEQLLRTLAAAHSVSVACLRLGEVGASKGTQSAPVNDLVHNFLDILSNAGLRPEDIRTHLKDMVIDILPVDWVAQLAGSFVMSDQEKGFLVVNAVNPKPVSLSDLLLNQHPLANFVSEQDTNDQHPIEEHLSKDSFTIRKETVNQEDWLERLETYVLREKEHYLNGIELFFAREDNHALWMDYFTNLKLDNYSLVASMHAHQLSDPVSNVF